MNNWTDTLLGWLPGYARSRADGEMTDAKSGLPGGFISMYGPGQLANGIEIRLRSGFGPAASDVPDELRQAIRSLAAHWYENRKASSEPMVRTVPMGVSALVSAHRGISL
jgi:uncharacterized phiE125 gp8 family phage protein